MIYIWYHDRVQQAIKILQNVVIFDLIIIVFYGLIDVCYQNGQMWAQNVLAIVNPILHDSPSINWSAVEFHPGLFWNGQVRSIFLEPSYFGNFMAFAFPILWWKICDTNGNNNKIGLFLLFIVLTFEVILSKSRTGALVLLGETVLYVVVVVYRKDRRLFTMGLSGIIAFLIAFGTANLFSKYAQFPVNWMGGRLPLATFKSEGKIPEETIALGDIIDSLFNKEKTSIEKQESNHSRLTITKTDFIIGKEHILLGVGKSMRSAYLRDKLANDPGREIQDWNRRADENGVLSADGMYFAGCDYTSRFSETGILGIILYCLPIVSVSWIYLHKVFNRQMPMTEIYPFLFCGISLAGMMVSGVGDALTLTFCPWMALGISFLLCFG